MLAADLTVLDISGTQSFYNVGDLVHAEVVIGNIGTFLSNSGPFQLEFWLSRQGDTSKFRHIETANVINVPRSAPASDIINPPGWRIPTNVPQGNYHITVYLDTGNSVNEENESNNVGTSASFNIGKPELVVSSVAADRTDYAHGQLLNAEAIIANTGWSSTLQYAPLGFGLEFWLGSVDGVNKMQHHIENATVAFINSDGSTTDRINGLGWVIPPGVAGGTYRVWVKVDAGAQVPERNEENNWTGSQIIRIGLPDLRIDAVDLGGSANIYAYNDLLSAVATIRNAEAASTLPQAPLGFGVSFYLGAADADTDDERMIYDLQDAVIAFLNGGQSTTDNVSKLLLPTAFQPGEYRVWVRADPLGEVAESNEDNNWGFSQVLTIQGARWENEAGELLSDTIEEATPIYLALYTGEVDPGLKIVVDIWEDDTVVAGDGNDLLETVALNHFVTSAGYKWRRRWVPYRTDDQVGGQAGDPEYFFRVQNPMHLPGLFDASSNLTVIPQPGDFGVLLVEHTVGAGVPLVLVHGNESEDAPDLYRWKGLLNRIESNPQDFAEFDVYLWKHNTERAVGFNGAAGSQAAGLADYIYQTLGVGQPGAYEDTKVALIAHSQGGLVSRGFMNTFNPTRGHMQGEDVSTLITLGTPHHGSPFGTEDWLAVLWSDLFNGGNEAGFNQLRTHLLQRGNGDLNLAWDNMDGVVDRAFFADFLFDPDAYVLTPHDTNRESNFPDPTVVYLDGLKQQYGTLTALNENERYLHKLLTVGAYDSDLSNNMPVVQFSAALLSGTGLTRHEQLSAATNLLAQMSGEQLGNDNTSNYFANDGLVPLQSALFLNLSETGTSISSKDEDEKIEVDAPEQLDTIAPRDVQRLVFSTAQGIQDHVNLLDTAHDHYWIPITSHLRTVLETTPPTASPMDPGAGAAIAMSQLNGRGYIDVAFADAGGSTIDPLSVLDGDAEFTLTGAAAAGVAIDGAPVRLDGDGHVYRYAFTGQFAAGTVAVEFTAGSFADDPGNLSTAHSATFEVVVDDAPPTVLSILVSGSAWSDAFLNHLADEAMGVGGYAIPTGTADQSDPLPWANLDMLTVRFSEAVTIDESQVRLTGVNGPGGDGSQSEYAIRPGTFRSGFNATTGTFEIAFELQFTPAATGIGNDRLLVTIDDSVADLAGNALDGDWQDGASTVSGDGAAGGDFAFNFSVLPGDVNQTAIVLGDDVILVRNAQFQQPGSQGYDAMFDVNGTGLILGDDIISVRNRQFSGLPTGAPTPAPALQLVSATMEPREASSLSEPLLPAAEPSSLQSEGGPRPDVLQDVLASLATHPRRWKSLRDQPPLVDRIPYQPLLRMMIARARSTDAPSVMPLGKAYPQVRSIWQPAWRAGIGPE